jgi:hypothetical protein
VSSPVTRSPAHQSLREHFDRLQKTATSDQERFDQMTELYPHWVANQPWLMFGFPQPYATSAADADASSRMVEGCPGLKSIARPWLLISETFPA